MLFRSGVVDRLIVLADGKVLADGTVQAVMAVDEPWLREYFSVRRTAHLDSAHGS